MFVATVPPTAPPTTAGAVSVVVESWDGWIPGGQYFIAGLFCAAVLLVWSQFVAPKDREEV